MKQRYLPSLLSVIITVLASPVFVTAGTGFNLGVSGAKKVTLDNRVNTNEAKFVSEAPLETIKGAATGVKGTFLLDPQNLEATTGEIIIAVKSMNTGIVARDGHLCGDDWLQEAKFPAITFKVEKLSDVKIKSTDASAGRGVAEAKAIGSFTMHGVSKPITIAITLTFVKESSATKQKVPGNFVFVQGKFSVNWKDFGVKGKASVAGKVSETITTDVNLFGADGL